MEIVTKKYLKSYAMLLEEIEGEEERLKALQSKINGSSIGMGDGMPHGAPDSDKMATQVCIIVDLKEKLQKLKKEEINIRSNIESALNKYVDLPQERRVIRLKYIDRMDWIEIQQILFGKRKDYYENEEKYRRLTFRIHGNALAKLNPHNE